MNKKTLYCKETISSIFDGKIKSKKAFVVYSNTDLTEGRGTEYPLYICETLTTAQRFGKGRYVQGSDCSVREQELYNIDNIWYGPVFTYPASPDDLMIEAKKAKAKELEDKKKIIYEKMLNLGLTQEEINTVAEK